jgi:hypothetical protein
MKMLFALSMLTQIRHIGDGRYTPSSRLYEYARKGHKQAIIEWWTPERRAQASHSRRGVAVHTPDSVARIRQYQLGKTWTDVAQDARLHNCITNAAKRKGTKWTAERHERVTANPYRHTNEAKQRLKERHAGKRLSSGRRVGYWFSYMNGSPILFCPLKLSAATYNISVHLLNRLVRGELVEHSGWTYVRPATFEEIQGTINISSQIDQQ